MEKIDEEVFQHLIGIVPYTTISSGSQTAFNQGWRACAEAAARFVGSRESVDTADDTRDRIFTTLIEEAEEMYREYGSPYWQDICRYLMKRRPVKDYVHSNYD